MEKASLLRCYIVLASCLFSLLSSFFLSSSPFFSHSLSIQQLLLLSYSLTCGFRHSLYATFSKHPPSLLQSLALHTASHRRFCANIIPSPFPAYLILLCHGEWPREMKDLAVCTTSRCKQLGLETSGQTAPRARKA